MPSHSEKLIRRTLFAAGVTVFIVISKESAAGAVVGKINQLTRGHPALRTKIVYRREFCAAIRAKQFAHRARGSSIRCRTYRVVT